MVVGYNIGDVIRRIKQPGNGGLKIGDTAKVITVDIDGPYKGWPATLHNGDLIRHNPVCVELVSPTTFEVGKLYKTSESQDLYEMLGVTETHIWYKNIRTGIHVSNPIEYDFSKSLEEYIPPPPEEWRALYWRPNSRPEVSAAYWDSESKCNEYHNNDDLPLGERNFMYAIRTDINAKKEN